MARRVEYVRGTVIRLRLRRDVTTRGGRRFRAGLTMTLSAVEGGLQVKVKIRGRWHSFTMQKKDGPWTFDIVSVPKPPTGYEA